MARTTPSSTSRPRGSKLPLLIVALMFAGVIASVVVVNSRPGADPSGKDAMPYALGVVVVGMVLILLTQMRWMRRAETADLEAAEQRATSLRDPGADAGSASAEEVQAALALKPGSGEDLAARREMWGFSRKVWRSGAFVALLVVILMPAAILTQNPKIMVFAAIPIVLAALVAAVNTLRPGGRLDEGYAISDRIMEPLGLRTVERPQWMPIPYADGTLHSTVIGPTVLGGERHGREVEVSITASRSDVAVAYDGPAFTAAGAKGGRLEAADDAPPSVRGALGTLQPAPVWTGAKIEAGDGRIQITRKRGGAEKWQHDLWLAERLAGAVR